MAIDPLDHSVTEALRAWCMQLDAGIGASDGLVSSASICPDAQAKALFEGAARLASNGESIEIITEALSPALSLGERALIIAGWNSGRMTTALEACVAQRELWLDTRRKIRSKMVFPAFVLLLAAIVAPLPALISNGSFLTYTLTAMAPLVVALVIWQLVSRLSQTRARLKSDLKDPRAIAPPSPIDRALLSIPLASGTERSRNISDCAGLMANLLSAGLAMSRALEICAQAMPNGFYRRDLAQGADLTRKGSPWSEALASSDLWPQDFVVAVKVGESTGKLDEVLRRLSVQMRERYIQSVQHFADWLPRIAYALIACFVVFQILSLLATIASAYSQAF